MKKRLFPALVIIPALLFSACSTTSNDSQQTPVITQTPENAQVETTQQSSKVVQVVAAENFYGDIVKQLGGNQVNVISILSDPNVDPHEYESNVQDGIAISNADIVIENGLDYDTWIDKLIAAAPNPHRILLTGGKIAPFPLPKNPHVWYGLNNIPAIATAITDSLKKSDPVDSATFDNNLTNFIASLTPLEQKIADIKSQFNGTPVGLTETIYLYQTQPMGLNVLTPFEFEKAIAEGNDPPASSVQTTNDQINKKQIKVLIFNSQTVTPITTNLLNTAKRLNIPEVYVTETMPQGKTYQTWMMDELNAVQKSLEGGLNT